MSSKKEKFFTVQFIEDAAAEPKTTKIPAKKGKSLKEAVDQVFVNHNFSYDTHSLFLEASKTPLPFTSECFMYGGCTLNIRANDDTDIDERVVSIIKDEERKSPVSYIERTKRYSDLLVHFLSHGFDEDATDGEDTFEKDSFLEPSWRDIVSGHEEMESKERVQQDSIWEILTTEKTYIQDLKVVTTVFKKCFSSSKEEGFLKEVDESLIFANIDEVYEVNVEFWKLLLNVLQNARKTRKPMKPSDLVHAFDRFEVLFRPYIKYCNQDTTNIVLPEYSDQTNQDIKNFFLWCDEHPKCKRIKLQGFLIKPLQRVTKYSLLLRAVERKTIDESEQLMLDNMISRVETFVSKINSAVHMRQEQEKLFSVVAKLETYTPVEPVNEEAEKIMNEYCMLDLKSPIPRFPETRKRFILKEGPMKLIDKQMKKDIQAFLFTDVFIFARLKKNTDKYKIIRPPFQINRTVIKALKDPGSFLFMYLNDSGVLTNAFILQINSHEQAQWLVVIDKAQKDYQKAIQEEEKRKEKENEDNLSDTAIMEETKGPRRRMPNRFSKRNSTIRGSNIDPFLSELTNKKLLVFAVVFLLLNIIFTRYFG